jgi:hypothetical protein
VIRTEKIITNSKTNVMVFKSNPAKLFIAVRF